MEPKEYLKKCTDKELFEIVNGVDYEIKNRLINLLKSHGCTVVFIPIDEGLEANVNDTDGTHKWGENEPFDKWVEVEEVGYATMLDEEDNSTLDFLYVVTRNGEQYTNDEINEICLWDLYKSVRDKFEEDKD